MSTVLHALGMVDSSASFVEDRRVRDSCAGGRLVYVDDLPLVEFRVGYGKGVGLHGSLGFESRRVKIGGISHSHSIGMHPPMKGEAFGTFDVSGQVDLEGQKRLTARDSEGGGFSVTFSTCVAINDGNNFFGTAGSKINFVVSDDETSNVLWRSDGGIRYTGVVQFVDNVDVTSVRKLKLSAIATGSNACAHAVFAEAALCVRSRDAGGRGGTEVAPLVPGGL